MIDRSPRLVHAALALTLAACSGEPAPASRPAPRPTGRILDTQHYELRGAGVSEGAAVAIEDVVAAPQAFAGKDLRISGSVVEVCKRKGCWMTLGDRERNVRVTFRDYGFFVPLDCEGREVIAEGRLEEREQSVEEIKHYLEDANRHEEAARVTEPRRTYSFVADGVALKKRAAK
jgi:starvation-inducible outer membrane lipoprotein